VWYTAWKCGGTVKAGTVLSIRKPDEARGVHCRQAGRQSTAGAVLQPNL
jgi:hypothetical protein